MTSLPRLPVAELTTSGRPIFLQGEVERYLLPGVDLESDGSDRPTLLLPFPSSLLVLTSHRLVFIDEPSASAREIPLSTIVHAFPLKKSMSIRSMFASPRVRLQVSISNDAIISEKGTKSVVITLIMRGKNTDPDLFYGRFLEVLRAREWELTASAIQGNTGHEGSSSASGVNDLKITMPVVGISGILRKEQEVWENTDKSLQDAFQDLNALMSKAKEMVQLAEKMRQKLLTTDPSTQSNSNDEEMGSKQDMQDWLLSVGIASPVTKETAGALYHQQLARQLADFVKVPLEKSGGMITLVDVYCLFNRARGTELISPEDLLQACALWEKFDVYVLSKVPSSHIALHISSNYERKINYVCWLAFIFFIFFAVMTTSPVMLRKFDSGVKVIQNKSHSDDEVFARISSLSQKFDALKKGISPSDAAFTLGIAPALAKEHLLSAESRGLLCRDVSAEGLRFYVNLFNEIDLANIYSIKPHALLNAWVSAIGVSC